MSKKAAEGLAALVLDVKVGKAALLSDKTAARQLAQLLVTYLRYCLVFLSVCLLTLCDTTSMPKCPYAGKKAKVKAFHTRHRALGPELIPMYRQSASR